MLELLVNNIAEFIGGIIIDDLEKIKKIKIGKIYDNLLNKNSFEKIPEVVKIISKKSVNHINKFIHGWLTKSTETNLKYAIETFKPKNILELGSWYGLSASFMIKLTPRSNFYFFDKFQNICLSPYKMDHPNVLNNFYLSYPRFETFYKNISELNPEGNIYAIRENAFKSLEILKKNNIEIDMIFIDFLKKTYELINFLKECVKYYPKAIIVDDLVFDSVQQALFSFISQQKFYVGILPESYIISPYRLIDYNKNYELFNKLKSKEENLKKGIFNNENDYYDYASYLIGQNHFDESLEIIKKYKLDMNKIKFNNEENLYHILCRTLFNLNKKDLIEPFKKYQNPSEIKNILLLTYNDYFNHKVYFS